MTVKILLEFLVVLAAIFLGSRTGGVGLGLWGGAGILVLSYFFGLPPTSAPIDVLLIILAVVMAAAVMEAAGGIDYLVGVAERIITRNPKHITIVAPLVSYVFSLGAGTGHVFYPLLPIIYEVAHENGIRPERPMTVSTIWSGDRSRSAISTGMGATLLSPPREAGGKVSTGAADSAGRATSSPSSWSIVEIRPNRPSGPPPILMARILVWMFDW